MLLGSEGREFLLHRPVTEQFFVQCYVLRHSNLVLVHLRCKSIISIAN
jgi:hypothetical protein